MPRAKHVGTEKPETKAEKSRRLANQRVGQALKYLNLVGNLAGPGYEFTPEQITQIVTTLQDAMNSVKDRFEGVPQSAAGFRLADKP